jgi:hypothetical protein
MDLTSHQNMSVLARKISHAPGTFTLATATQSGLMSGLQMWGF